jgi:hypothetical protein
MKTLALVALLVVVSSWACTPAGNTPATTDPATTPGDEPAAKQAAPAPAPEQELVVKSAELRVEGALVWFEPDSGVQRASYTRYAFDKAEFEKFVGAAKPETDVTLVIQITKTEEKTHTPADPHSPSPDGGFQITVHHAKILRLK